MPTDAVLHVLPLFSLCLVPAAMQHSVFQQMHLQATKLQAARDCLAEELAAARAQVGGEHGCRRFQRQPGQYGCWSHHLFKCSMPGRPGCGMRLWHRQRCRVLACRHLSRMFPPCLQASHAAATHDAQVRHCLRQGQVWTGWGLMCLRRACSSPPADVLHAPGWPRLQAVERNSSKKIWHFPFPQVMVLVERLAVTHAEANQANQQVCLAAVPARVWQGS